MRSRIIEGVIALGIGGILLWWVLRGFVWESLAQVIGRWYWMLFAAFAMTGAHVLRAWRWQLMLQASRTFIDWKAAWWALMVGYLVNLALPRVGEVVRCTLLWRWRKVSTPLAIGSVVAERIVDILTLILLAGVIVLKQGMNWLELLGMREYLPYLFAGVLLAAVGGVVIWRLWLRNRQVGVISQLVKGLISIIQARPRSLMIILSIGIWIGYWLAILGVMATCAEKDYASLAWASGILLVGSGLAMAIPVPGGLGTFHAIGLVLLLSLGWEKSLSQLIVVAAHAMQTLLLVILGIGGVIYASTIRYSSHTAR
ncbi:MAG: lysylphosphatidylglycerol synthase transmembrane domain-containing protein [Bacteroidia bacterium]|nr:lysylphosphatidylglycerol synthase transmembrane domain-containing protein [Bacteroidia bacterium]